MSASTDKNPRRGKTVEDNAYLLRVGERVRHARDRLGWTRKALAQASGVSERYLADLEVGLGNASLIVLRRVATALQRDMDVLLSEHPEPSPGLAATLKLPSQLAPPQIFEAHRLISRALRTRPRV